jgi:hypothetical protein
MENQIANGTIMITWHQFIEQALYIQPEGGHLQSFWISKQALLATSLSLSQLTNQLTNRKAGTVPITQEIKFVLLVWGAILIPVKQQINA